MFDNDVDEERQLRKQLGLLGSQMMNLNETIYEMNQNNRSDSYDDLGGYDQYQSFGRYDDDVIDSATDDIRGYRDDIRGYHDQLENTPIRAVLEEHEDESYFSPLIAVLNRHKHENDLREQVKRRSLELHFGNIMGALSTNDRDNSGQLLVTLRRWYNDFLWNLSRAAVGLMAGAVKSMFKSVYTGLFGTSGILNLIGLGKDTETDTQKIVKAIEQQTEYFMTGKIDQTKGLLKRLRQYGLIGSAVRGTANLAMSAVGLGRERYQESVIDKAAGVKRDTTGQSKARQYTDKMADFVRAKTYSDDTVKYGTISQIPQVGTTQSEESPFQTMMGELLKQHLTVTEDIYQAVDVKHARRNSDTIRSYGAMNDSFVASAKTETLERERQATLEKDRFEASMLRLEHGEKYQSEIVKYTKLTAKETGRHRRQAFFQRMLGGVGRLLTGLATLGTTIVTGIAGLVWKIMKKGGAKVATGATAGVTAAAKSGKLKYILGGIVAVAGALSKKGLIEGVKKLATGITVVGKDISKKGVKGSAKSVVEAAKGITKTDLKAAAVATAVAAGSVYKGAKKTVGDTLGQRAATRAGQVNTSRTTDMGRTGTPQPSTAPVQTGKKKMGGGVKLGAGILGAVALDQAVNMTDEKSKTGGAARTASAGAGGYFTGGIVGALIGGIVGAVKGGIVGLAAGGVGAIPGAIAGGLAGGATGYKAGSIVGGVGGTLKGIHDNKDALTGKAMADITPTASTDDGRVKSPHHTVENTDIDGSSKIKNAANQNELWAKPTMDEPKDENVGVLKALQESIAMPLDYVKDLYSSMEKVGLETIGKLTEGNEINKEVARTLKEMSVKLDASESSPFGNMIDPMLGKF